MITYRKIALLLLMAGLAACGSDSDTEKKHISEQAKEVAGKSYSVLRTRSAIETDPALREVTVKIPPLLNNQSWPQRGANARNALGALKLDGFAQKDSAKIGKGEAWKTALATAPVMADGTIYAMDAKGYVSAHTTHDLDDVKWISDVPVAEGKAAILGGGLAVANGAVFAATGQGNVFAVKTSDGSKIWEKNLGAPIRSAPKIDKGVLYVMTVDNQLYAMDTALGEIRWQHHGLAQGVGFLSAVSPAIGDNFVVVTYSSGEVFGLAVDSGQPIWSDSLTVTRRTSATSVFTGVDGDPVMAGGVVFASSNNGLTTATQIYTGQRLWEQEVPAADTPWLTDNFVFILSADSQIVALHASDGKIKWVRDLPRYENTEKQTGALHWHGPLVVNDSLLVVGDQGEAYILRPNDGRVASVQKIPNGVAAAPIVVDGTLYLVTRDASLHALR